MVKASKILLIQPHRFLSLISDSFKLLTLFADEISTSTSQELL